MLWYESMMSVSVLYTVFRSTNEWDDFDDLELMCLAAGVCD